MNKILFSLLLVGLFQTTAQAATGGKKPTMPLAELGSLEEIHPKYRKDVERARELVSACQEGDKRKAEGILDTFGDKKEEERRLILATALLSLKREEVLGKVFTEYASNRIRILREGLPVDTLEKPIEIIAQYMQTHDEQEPDDEWLRKYALRGYLNQRALEIIKTHDCETTTNFLRNFKSAKEKNSSLTCYNREIAKVVKYITREGKVPSTEWLNQNLWEKL
jgi:hypothetical protein